MKKHIFEYVEHQDYGFYGFRLDGREDFDPTTGIGVSHDMFEHAPLHYSNGNSLANEFMAFGGSVWVRDENGIEQSFVYRDFESLGHSVISLVSEEVFRSEDRHSLIEAPKARSIEYGSDDDIFSRSVDFALAKLIEYGAELDIEDYENEDSEYHTESYHFIKNHRNDIINWMRKGYRYVAKRFYGLDQYAIGQLFQKVTKLTQNVANQIEENQKVALYIDFKNGEARYEILDEFSA